jgi:hypothetical protein
MNRTSVCGGFKCLMLLVKIVEPVDPANSIPPGTTLTCEVVHKRGRVPAD